MDNVVSMKMTGLRELQQALERKPRNIARKLLRVVLARAANIWRQEMSRLAPQLQEVKLSTSQSSVRIPGDLSRHIGLSASVNSDLEGTVRVGPTKRVFWGLWAEFGQHGKHQQAAQPFIRTSYESKKDDVLNSVIEQGKVIVEEENRA